jgi:hypothetical protein
MRYYNEDKVRENLKDFIVRPEYSVDKIDSCKKDLENRLNKRAKALENNLENSDTNEDGDLRKKISYFCKPDESDPALKLSLFAMVRIDNNFKEINPKQQIELALESDNIDYSEEQKILLRKLLVMYPGNTEDYQKNKSVSDGMHHPDWDKIMIRTIPRGDYYNISIPNIFKYTMDWSMVPEKHVNATLLHELSHSWLEHNVNSDIKFTDELKTIEEIFNYYISYICDGLSRNPDQGDYEYPNLIKWGTEILIQKTREIRDDEEMMKMGVDFAREISLNIFREAQSDGKSGLNLFLKRCLMKEDRKRLTKFREISVKIESALEEIIKNLSEYVREQNLRARLKNISREYNWLKAEKIHDEILSDLITMGRLKPERDLYWINRRITEKLEQSLEILQEYINDLNKIQSRKVKNTELLENKEREIVELKRELETIIKQGEKA